MKPTTWIFLGIGILLQIITFSISPDSPMALLSGLLGVCSVVLGAQANILTFVFGFAQVLTYSYLCWQQRFYGELLLNAYYFFTMIYGVYVWRSRLFRQDDRKLQVQTRRLSQPTLMLVVVGSLLLSIMAGWLLQTYTDDTQPYLDAFTTVPALVAQILMILVYREQWYVWLLVDVLATIMWIQAGNYCMAAQYAFWFVDFFYGFHQWNKALSNATEK